MSDPKTVLSSVGPDQYGSLVVELQVLKEDCIYNMVGVIMDITDDSLRIAFSSKEDTVDDSLEVAVTDVRSIQIISESEIEILS